MLRAPPEPVSFDDLVSRHRGILFDSYGVLRDDAGLLPGVRERLLELERRGVPCWVVTNDASRPATTMAATLGDVLAPERFLTAGALVTRLLRERWPGRFVGYLGPASCAGYLADGGNPHAALPALGDLDCVEVVALMDDSGFDWRRELPRVVNLVRARPEVPVLLPNPDPVYPCGGGAVGIGVGAVGALLERALGQPLLALGKPGPGLFELALERARELLGDVAPGELLMVGDTLVTDVAGAQALGIETALTLSGNTPRERLREEIARYGVCPSHVVTSVGAGSGAP